MRCCYCSGTLIEVDGRLHLQAPGLQIPMALLFDKGQPDLQSHLGKVVTITGNLEAGGTNQEELNVHLFGLEATEEATPTPVIGVFSGNIGKSAELSPKAPNGRQRLTTSLAYFSQDNQTSWLRLSCSSTDAAFQEFSELQPGARIVATGTLTHYTYNKKNRLELALKTFDLEGGSSYKPPEVLYKADSASGASPEPIPGF